MPCKKKVKKSERPVLKYGPLSACWVINSNTCYAAINVMLEGVRGDAGRGGDFEHKWLQVIEVWMILKTTGPGGEVWTMFNNKKRSGFLMQGAWIQVFCNLECT